MNKLDLVSLRDYKPEDRSFILATWLRGLYYGNEWFGTIDKEIYFKIYHDVVDNLIKKPETIVKILCLKDDEDVILGYAVYKSDALHWVHVKSAWRGIGLGNMLVPKEIPTVTHLTKVGRSLLFRKGLKFNPFAI